MTILAQSYSTRTPRTFIQPDLNETFKQECSRLIHAAVVSRSFRTALLENPLQAVEAGYCGEKFAFTRDEKRRLKNIQARSIEDFSAQLLRVMEMPAVSEFAFARR